MAGERPIWSEDQSILFVDGVICKQFGQPAENQRAILREFQRQGWPAWIANPLEPDCEKDDRQRLADAVYHLNRGQKKRLIRFRRNGRGKGILWELLKKKKR